MLRAGESGVAEERSRLFGNVAPHCVIHEEVVFMRSITSLQLFQRCQIAVHTRGNAVALPAVSSMTLIGLVCGR